MEEPRYVAKSQDWSEWAADAEELRESWSSFKLSLRVACSLDMLGLRFARKNQL